MPTRRVHHLAAATAAVSALTTVLTTVLATTPAHADGGALYLVLPGESIQQAVDAARPGDTIQVLPGTYRGSVRITTPGLTLRGSGPVSMIVPGDGTENACAASGHGLCVAGPEDAPLRGLTIEAMDVSGFRKNGIDITGTTGMNVRANFVHDNGEQGISQEVSTRAAIVGNSAFRNGQSGVFLANHVDRKVGAPVIGTVVAGNRLTDNRIGVTARRLRGLSIEDNDIRANCGGVFVVGDETTPRAGDLDITRNTVTGNNKYCEPNPRLGAIQGAGVVLTGVEAARVTDNEIRDNAGASDFSGGVVLFKSVVGMPNARNVITGNRLSGNAPADLADRDTGTGNAFARNECSVSEPSGHC
ncbi:right-handed parallel beta-helix repeat-containing protein [Kitasatospora sp. NPDC001660]